MSPKVLTAGTLIFWFHSFDALRENRAGVHVGKGSQDNVNDAKVGLEPEVSVARTGRILRQHELRHALKVIEDIRYFLLEQWNEFNRQIK
jgi:hypothetical protein